MNRQHLTEAFVSDICDSLRDEADYLRTRGIQWASFLEAIIEEIERSSESWLSKPLTLREAAELSGYAYSSLSAMVLTGQLPNVGEKGRPRVRRRDLPFKAINQPPEPESASPTSLNELVDAEIDFRERGGI